MELLSETPSLSPPMQNSSSPTDNEPDDLKKLLKWQDERQARRLRGEYESAVLHLSELINSSRSTAVNIRAVRVDGAHNTRKSFLGFLINPVLSQEGGDDLEGVLHKTRQISDILQRTDIFTSVEAKVERSRDPLAAPNDLDVIFKTRERGWYHVNTSTLFGDNDANGSLTARLRNVFGGAESLEANMSIGTTTKKSFAALLTAPVSPNLDTRADLTIYGLRKDNKSFASSEEEFRGVKALVRNGTLSTGMNEFAYEAVLRNIGALAPTASISIREAAGLTTKSSLSHTFTFDSRAFATTAAQGVFLKTHTELAGLGGDARFLKTEAAAQVSQPLFSNINASLTWRSGVMWGLGRPTLVSDRFNLGGPTSLRMAEDGEDSLGGDLYWAAGLSFIADLPKKPQWPLKLHSFVNVGRLDAMDKSQSLVDNVKACITRPSVSAGVGLIYRFDPVRVELNVGVPLLASASDSTRKGVQVGMGIDFL
ncbi:hypothetical protein BDZ89DRAFT_1097988 [Hymenopellis radicata]|nr:hypothetical protein BDZ89DRAFT_1097988 [Hymenopellis radicata]